VHGAVLRLLARLAAAVGLLLASAVPALATTVVQMSDADLAAQAAAVLLGRVTALQSHLDTTTGRSSPTLALEEVVEGPALPATVTLRQPGGRVGGLHAWVDGSPEFVIGERVLVYVRVTHDGTLRVLQLYQGKLSVFTDDLTGDDVAIRINGGGVRVLAPSRRGPTSPPKDTHRVDDLRRAIRGGRARTAPPASAAPLQPTLPAPRCSRCGRAASPSPPPRTRACT
jgi:hypothetical protein